MKNKMLHPGKLVLVILALLMVGGAVFTWQRHYSHGTTTPTAIETSNKKKAAVTEAAGKKTLIEEDTPASTSDKSTAPATSYVTPNDASKIKISASQSGGSVTITSQLYGYSDGTCDLSITNGSHTYGAKADVIYQSQFSTCAGFSVPAGELGAGTWKIRLSVTSQGLTNANTTTAEVQ